MVKIQQENVYPVEICEKIQNNNDFGTIFYQNEIEKYQFSTGCEIITM